MASLSLVFDLIGRDVSASRAFKDVGGAAERAGKQGQGFGSSISTGMKAAAGAIAAVGIGGLLKSAVDGASNLNETLNKSNVIFGQNAGKVEAWAGGAAKSFGLSRAAALEAASGFGNMLQQLGYTGDAALEASTGTVKLAADLGSFNNLETGDVLDRIGAAMRGEYDSLQLLIPNINAARVEQEAMAMTGKDAASSLTAQEKAAATLAIVQRDGAAASNDFAETSDGLANKTKIAAAQFEDAKAAIGNAFLPAMASAMGFISDTAIPALGRLWEILKNNVGPIFTEIVGGIRAFGAAWTFNDGEITSSGLPGFMERVGYFARQTFDYMKDTVVPALVDFGRWVQRNSDIILPFVAALGAGYVVFQTITAITKAWAAAQAILNAVMAANPIGLVIVALAALAAGLVIVYQRSETFRAIVDAAFRVVAATAEWLWSNILKPIFGLIVDTFGLVAAGISRAWSGIIKPVFEAYAAVAQWLWNNILRPYFGFIAAGWDALGRGLRAVYDNVIAPVWGVFRSGIEGLQRVFQTVKDAIGRIWDGLVDAVKAPIRITFQFVNDRMIGPVNSILDKFPGNLKIPLLPRLAGGGLLRGPGTGTSDSILGVDPRSGVPTAAVSNGEFVVNAKQTRKHLGLIRAINAGMGQFADGGLVGRFGVPGHNLGDLVGGIWDKATSAAASVKNFAGDMIAKGARKAAEFVLGPIRDAAKALIPNKVPLSLLSGGIDRLYDAVLGGGDEQDKALAAARDTTASGGSSSGLIPLMAAARQYTMERYGIRNIGGFARRNIAGTRTLSDHALGKAIDIMTTNRDLGWAIANDFAFGNASRQFRAENVIWQQMISSRGGPFRRMADRGSPTQNHYDHIHVDTFDKGGYLKPGYTLAFNGTGRNESIRTAEQESALGRPAQLTGNLYLDSGELLGVVRGVIQQDKADVSRNSRSS